MIKKERLEELIEYEKKHIGDVFVFEVDGFQEINTVQINSDRDVCLNGKLCRMAVDKSLFYDEILLENLFEDEEEAKFVAKYHTTRVEKFEPPYKLKENEKFHFTSKKGAKMSIHKFRDGEWWLSYVGTHRYCETYEEAVERAYKLFKGEE